MIINLTKNSSISEQTRLADSYWRRFRGLMMRKEFPAGSALVIDPCTSIHMFFMRFPIDVLYLNAEDEVVRTQKHFKPWRIGPLRTSGARFVVELPSGAIQSSETEVGDQIRIQIDTRG